MINAQTRQRGYSILQLLNLRGQAFTFAVLLEFGLIAGWLLVTRLAAPVWFAAVLTLGLLLVPATRKWQVDQRELGWPLTILGILLATQGFHTIEHIAQWVQFHLLNWPIKASSGIISPLNAEIVHFTWNWAVLMTVGGLLLMFKQHNVWMWLLWIWAFAHTTEHTYLFINYLNSGRIQGLPGFFGVGGWLAQNNEISASLAWLCELVPGMISAPRLDIHFWWNVGEIILLVLAANTVPRTSA